MNPTTSLPIHHESGPAPEVSVIVVNWNSKNFVRQCLRTLEQHCLGTSYEVIVVDGASFDGCDQMLTAEFPTAVYVQSPQNIGFGRCNNLGAQQARGSRLLFLNPDTELLEDSLTVLARQLDALPEAGLVGCKLLNKDRSLQMSCVQSFPTVLNQVIDSHFLRKRFPRSRLWGMEVLYQSDDTPMEVNVIAGACMMIPKVVFEAVGGFSSQYFMFGEDLDLCFKIRKAGFKVYCAPETRIVHHGGGSTQYTGNFASAAMRDSVHKFQRAHRGRLAATCYRAAMALNATARLVLALPCLMIPGQALLRHGTGSLHKWLSILRWSLGKPVLIPSSAGTSADRALSATPNTPLPTA